MPSHPTRRRRRRLLAGAASIAIALLAASGVVTAHSGKPASITVGQSGLSVQASGSWTWAAEAADSIPSYIGYAISWGDVSSGNTVGTYHIGDGTSATNVVLQPTNPAQGSSGTWGPVGHTYKTGGTYTICVIIYDLGEVKPFATTGWDSTQAGGVGHNADNSVDNGHEPGVKCATVQVSEPTPTAFQSFEGETATPAVSPTDTPFQSFEGETAVPTGTATPPPTSTAGGSASGGSLPELPLLLFAVLSFLGALALKPIRSGRE